MKIPLFPLQSNLFQEKQVAASYFEERYKQLKPSKRSNTFGIPSYNNRNGVSVEVQLVANTKYLRIDGEQGCYVCVARSF